VIAVFIAGPGGRADTSRCVIIGHRREAIIDALFCAAFVSRVPAGAVSAVALFAGRSRDRALHRPHARFATPDPAKRGGGPLVLSPKSIRPLGSRRTLETNRPHFTGRGATLLRRWRPHAWFRPRTPAWMR
jgi:hypothetical protein